MVTRAQSIERLTRLADKLEGVGPYAEVGPVPARQFDMRTWLRTGDAGAWQLRVESRIPKTVKALLNGECGTAACACGWASTDPWFRQRGYKAENADWDTHNFFGLYYSDFGHLFLPKSYRSDTPRPTTVARRIRAFVRKLEAQP